MIPNIAKPTSATDEIATSNAFRRKNESGIIGSGWRLSHHTKLTSSTAAAIRKPMVCGDDQLCEFVRISAHTSENRPAVTSTVPTMSNRRAFGRPSREFVVADIVRDALPAADLILCRHLLIHLSFGQGLAALENFRRTGARYLLVTTNPSVQENREIVHTGSFRPVNMERAPFVLPRPLEVLPDPQGPDDPTVLGLYLLNS